MGGDLVIGRLGDDDERATALRVLDGELEQDHGGIAMPDEIDLLQFQTIEYAQQFPGAFGQPDETRAIFLASIHDDSPRPAERLNLARVDPFEMFEDGYEDQGFSLADIDERHIDVPYGKTL